MRLLLLVVISSFVLAGCDRTPASAKTAGTATLLIAPEDLIQVHTATLGTGSLITGTIQPDRRADLRAEVPAVVVAVLKENGEAVRKGDLLVRLDDTAIRDSLLSAQEAERAATRAFDQAERQFQRLNTLRASGMVSAQQLEDAEIHRNTTQSDLSAAKARVVQARQQLQRTEVRAPFDGIVSERKASAGDTAQVGKELLKVIDPRSLRFEGLVSSDALSSVKPGQNVAFRVNGWGSQDFKGRRAHRGGQFHSPGDPRLGTGARRRALVRLAHQGQRAAEGPPGCRRPRPAQRRLHREGGPCRG